MFFFFCLELFFFTTCLVDTRQGASYVAKCHLGKVKIKPMLVVGCVCWGQQITVKVHVTLCGGWSQGLGTSLRWGCTLLVCLRIVAFS